MSQDNFDVSNIVSLLDEKIDLTIKENWTPLLLKIHRRALLVGLFLGSIIGSSSVILAAYIIKLFWS